MLKSFKTEMNPSKEQIVKINKTIGTCRYIYNFYLSHNQELYEKGEPFLSGKSFSVWLNNDYLPNIFYVSRLISSQKERDFSHSDFNDIHRVYSIWICMNMKENTMSHIHFTKEDLIGSCDRKGNLELANIVMATNENAEVIKRILEENGVIVL